MKTNKCLSLLLALVLCFTSLASTLTVAFAENEEEIEETSELPETENTESDEDSEDNDDDEEAELSEEEDLYWYGTDLRSGPVYPG